MKGIKGICSQQSGVRNSCSILRDKVKIDNPINDDEVDAWLEQFSMMLTI